MSEVFGSLENQSSTGQHARTNTYGQTEDYCVPYQEFCACSVFIQADLSELLCLYKVWVVRLLVGGGVRSGGASLA